ncbi:MAG TPA: STAS domain-containing protein [Miltoncostaeaceae bacterium]|nr:STAS domain-containing protein [Miltoncostaeaceae bacterium]
MTGKDYDTPAFRLEAAPAEGAALLVVEGELDIASAERLVGAVEALSGESGEPVVLDLSGVSFVDSSGVRALLEVERVTQGMGRPLALLRPSSAVTRLLELIDMRRRFVELDATDPASLARAAAGAEGAPG